VAVAEGSRHGVYSGCFLAWLRVPLVLRQPLVEGGYATGVGRPAVPGGFRDANQVNIELKDRQEWLGQVAGRIDARMISNPAALQAYLEQRLVMFQMFNGGAWVAGLDGVAIADVPSSAQRLGVNYLSVDLIASVLKDGNRCA